MIGCQDKGSFAIAVCELGGLILVYDESKFNSITEDEVTRDMSRDTVGVMKKVKEKVIQLFSSE